ncbi:MAG: hypothetical protein WC405_12560 [Syntrophales bacterium]
MKYNYTNSKLMFLPILLIVFSFLGCAGDLVCRHHALELASYGVEKNMETRISIYKINDLAWDSHAQAQVKVDGKWKWMTDWFGYVSIEDDPTFKPTGYMLFLTIPEYLEVLKKGSYSTTTGNTQ